MAKKWREENFINNMKKNIFYLERWDYIWEKWDKVNHLVHLADCKKKRAKHLLLLLWGLYQVRIIAKEYNTEKTKVLTRLKTGMVVLLW